MMSFGLTNIPTIFVGLMDEVFNLYLHFFIINFINDIWCTPRVEKIMRLTCTCVEVAKRDETLC